MITTNTPRTSNWLPFQTKCKKTTNIGLWFVMIILIFMTLIGITYLSIPEHSHSYALTDSNTDSDTEIEPKSFGTNLKQGIKNEQKINENNAKTPIKETQNGKGESKNDDKIEKKSDDINNKDKVKFPKSDFNAWIQYNLQENESDEPGIFEKRNAIRNTFIKAYNDYDKHCHGEDELTPMGARCQNWLSLGISIVDSVDTMYLMGLNDMLKPAREWISTKLSFESSQSQSFFETVIRCLGGLVSIYDLTKDKMYLEKARDLANRLSKAFDTPSGLPLSEINLQNGHANSAHWTGGSVLLAEIGTIQIEFQSLSDRLNDNVFGSKVSKVFELLDPQANTGIHLPLRGQYPIYIDPNNVKFRNSHVTWGAMGDSFYEYLLKYWIYTGKKPSSRYRRMFVDSVMGMKEHLYRHNKATNLYYIAEWRNGQLDDKMDELACFTGGTIALGLIHEAYFDDKQREIWLSMSTNLAETCYHMFHDQQSGLSPEFVRFSEGGMSNGIDFYILRPETIETFFYLYRLTRDVKWRNYGWEIYLAIEKSCRVPEGAGAGYVPILSVGHDPHQDPNGVMHSFFMAETLKYLYLLFSNVNVFSLDVFVFNTEAHGVLIPEKSLAPQ